MNEKKAKWIVIYNNRLDYSTYSYACSRCKGEPLRDRGCRVIFSKYCPHCGSRMNEGTEDEQ